LEIYVKWQLNHGFRKDYLNYRKNYGWNGKNMIDNGKIISENGKIPFSVDCFKGLGVDHGLDINVK
jgi:hypothetical protein